MLIAQHQPGAIRPALSFEFLSKTPSQHEERRTDLVLAGSSIFAAAVMAAAAYGLGMRGFLWLLLLLGVSLFMLMIWSARFSSSQIQYGLFKYAPAYMLSSMLLIIIHGFSRGDYGA